jgi:hypothetical protein
MNILALSILTWKSFLAFYCFLGMIFPVVGL